MGKLNHIIIAIVILFLVAISGCTISEYKVPDTCGNGICDMRVDGYPNGEQYNWDEESVVENYINCPSECTVQPTLEEVVLQPIRPIVSGLRLNPTSGCTVGFITVQGGSKYMVTNRHCFIRDDTFNYSGTYTDPDSYIGVVFQQGGQRIGEIERMPKDYAIDVALVRIDDDVEAAQMTAFQDRYYGYATPYIGERVMKVGSNTGTTYGTVTNVYQNYLIINKQYQYYETMKIQADDGSYFSLGGDSGSAILTADSPHRFVGIVNSYNTGITADSVIFELDLQGAS